MLYGYLSEDREDHTMSIKRAALYLRTSTTQQTTENQRLALTEFAKRAGYEIVEEYEDHGVSGAKGRDKRPEFDRMLKDATRRQFDIILAWSVDRLGRSLQDLVGEILERVAVFFESLPVEVVPICDRKAGILHFKLTADA
jgi:Resolvase, N terminal domain